MSPKKSLVWRYFEKKANGFAVCKLCSKKLRTSGNTTNLSGHLDRIHKNHVFTPETAANLEEEVELENLERCNNLTKENINVSLASTITLPGSETYENTDKESLQTDVCLRGNEITNINNIVQSFKNITAFKRGGEKERHFTNAILFLLCKDNLPLATVEHEGFNYLLKTIAPLYKIPSRKTFSTFLNTKYDMLTNILKERLVSYEYFNLSADIYTETSQTKSYLGVTLHYLDKLEMKSVTLGVYPLSERHTSDYISQKMEETIAFWNLPKDKIIGVVTDSAANIVKAVNDTFTEKKHLPCLAYTLNLVVENTFKLSHEITSILNVFKNIVTYFKQSVTAADKLRSLQIKDGVPEGNLLKLKQEVPTRWNSRFLMIQRFLKLWKYIAEILLNDSKAPVMLTAFQMEILKELQVLLKPLETATRELSGERFVTISKIIPIVHCIENAINKVSATTDEVMAFQEELLQQMKKRFGQAEKVEKLAVSTLLDPRFRKIHFQDYLAVGAAVNIIKKRAKEFASQQFSAVNDKETIDVSVPVEHDNEMDFDIWDHHKSLTAIFCNEAKKTQREDIDTILSQEITTFLSSPVSDLKENPFQTWQILKLSYPHLYKVAVKYLQLIATSVPAERLFSKVGCIMDDRRSRLKPENLNKMAFLSSLDKKDWNLPLA